MEKKRKIFILITLLPPTYVLWCLRTINSKAYLPFPRASPISEAEGCTCIKKECTPYTTAAIISLINWKQSRRKVERIKYLRYLNSTVPKERPTGD